MGKTLKIIHELSVYPQNIEITQQTDPQATKWLTNIASDQTIIFVCYFYGMKYPLFLVWGSRSASGFY